MPFPYNPTPSSPRRSLSRRRSLLAALALATGFTCAQNSSAAVTFQFNFTDPANTGFNDPQYAAAKAGIIDAGQTMGAFFDNTATITIKVTSTNTQGTGDLAAAGSDLISTNPGFHRSVVQEKVISNGANDANGAEDDGFMTVNLGNNYQYDPNAVVATGQYDFKGTVIHELAHAFGFASSINSATPDIAAAARTDFDRYLADASGNPLFNPQTFAIDQSKLPILVGGNSAIMDTPGTGGLYFNGTQAKAAYYNQQIPLYSPSAYKPGSSTSHVDDFTTATRFYMMASAVESAGGSAGKRFPRQFSSGEIGIMKDLGYTLSVVYPPFFNNEYTLQDAVYYLSFSGGTYFGYFTYLNDPRYVYHYDLGYEYTFDAKDANSGIFLYDFKSQHFFYTSPSFPFPYLYDFSLNATLYYYPDPSNAGRYNTNGVRYFYNFATNAIITQ